MRSNGLWSIAKLTYTISPILYLLTPSSTFFSISVLLKAAVHFWLKLVLPKNALKFCCGSKLHFATCKSFEGKQDHYVCSKYKSGRGTCSAHYIREEVLRDIVLERIQAVNEYIRQDAEGFQEEWLRCRRADQRRISVRIKSG